MEEKFYLCKQNQEGMKENQKIVIYQTEDGQTQIDVWLENDTVWLTRQQLATLFGRDYKTISKHQQWIARRDGKQGQGHQKKHVQQGECRCPQSQDGIWWHEMGLELPPKFIAHALFCPKL